METDLIRKHSDLLTDISVAGRKLRTLFDAFAKDHDMTLPRARALFLLSKHESMTQTELAAALEIETPTLVRMLDGLEKQAFITRRVAEDDRRVKYVALTSEAYGQVEELQAVAETLRLRVLAGLPEADIDQGLRILRLILKNMDELS